MFWKYLLFETKLLLLNKKNWLLGLALILFFPLYYSHYSQLDIVELKEEVTEKAEKFYEVFDSFPGSVWETEEGKEIYENLLEQTSLLFWQRHYLSREDNLDGFFGAGQNFQKFFDGALRLNELRLDLHQRGNKGIHRDHIVPVDEILKENALYQYHKEHGISLVQDPLKASNYIPVALNVISGTLFCVFVLLAGSSMLLNEQNHRTVMFGFPISFMQKVISKISVVFIQIMLFLCASILVGSYYVAEKTGWGDFRTPVLIYQDADFIAVSMLRYVVYMLVAFGLIALFLLSAFLFVNLVTKNLYASILIILFVLMSPQLLLAAGVETNLLYPLKVMDIGAVLSGDAAKEYGIEQLDFKHAYSWLVILNMLILSILFVRNKFVHIRKVEAVIGIFICSLILSGCHHLQGTNDEMRIDYADNYEITGATRDVISGKAHQAIFTTADRSNKGAKRMYGPMPRKEGAVINVEAGRYKLTGNPSGNIFIYDKDDNLLVREIVGDKAGMPSLTVDVDPTFSIFFDGGYNSVTIAPVQTILSTELTTGIWDVGLDIEPGNYTMSIPQGYGFVHIFEEGKDPRLFELFAGGMTNSESLVQLKEGQKIRVSKVAVVNFEIANKTEQ